MNTMQTELNATYPALKIKLLGVNQRGQEPGNVSATNGVDLPWLQDVDENQNNSGDVADDLWGVTFRDVVILDGDNEQVGVYSLSARDLEDQENYATLREMLVDAAMLSQLPWMNATNPLDVDANGQVVPLDVLLVVNQLEDAGSHKLPAPTTAELTQPYYDTNGDGDLTPLDPLQIINFLNDNSNQAEGEASSSDSPQAKECHPQAAEDMPVRLRGTPHPDQAYAARAALNRQHLAVPAAEAGHSHREFHPKDVDGVFSREAISDSLHTWELLSPRRLETNRR